MKDHLKNRAGWWKDTPAARVSLSAPKKGEVGEGMPKMAADRLWQRNATFSIQTRAEGKEMEGKNAPNCPGIRSGKGSRDLPYSKKR
jgi:hypothetical protein